VRAGGDGDLRDGACVVFVDIFFRRLELRGVIFFDGGASSSRRRSGASSPPSLLPLSSSVEGGNALPRDYRRHLSTSGCLRFSPGVLLPKAGASSLSSSET
jgi:hypothetical protein